MSEESITQINRFTIRPCQDGLVCAYPSTDYIYSVGYTFQ